MEKTLNFHETLIECFNDINPQIIIELIFSNSDYLKKQFKVETDAATYSHKDNENKYTIALNGDVSFWDTIEALEYELINLSLSINNAQQSIAEFRKFFRSLYNDKIISSGYSGFKQNHYS